MKSIRFITTPPTHLHSVTVTPASKVGNHPTMHALIHVIVHAEAGDHGYIRVVGTGVEFDEKTGLLKFK